MIKSYVDQKYFKMLKIELALLNKEWVMCWGRQRKREIHFKMIDIEKKIREVKTSGN